MWSSDTNLKNVSMWISSLRNQMLHELWDYSLHVGMLLVWDSRILFDTQVYAFNRYVSYQSCLYLLDNRFAQGTNMGKYFKTIRHPVHLLRENIQHQKCFSVLTIVPIEHFIVQCHHHLQFTTLLLQDMCIILIHFLFNIECSFV